MVLTRFVLRALLFGAIVVNGPGVCAQVAAPYIPTPSQLGDQVPAVGSGSADMPLQAVPVAPQLRRPEGNFSIDVKRYVVSDGAPRALRNVLDSITKDYVGANRSFSDLSEAARQVTRYMQSELGYYLGYAYIPAQQPDDGIVRIEVLEGRLDGPVELIWDADACGCRSMVEGYLSELSPGSVLLVRDVERVVFLVNDLRGISAEFEVSAGTQPGTAKLVARVTQRIGSRWSVDSDNANSKYLGTWRAGAAYNLSSPFGRGDSFSVNAKVASGLQFLLANYTTPVGSSGLRVGASFSDLSYQIDKQYFALGLRGTANSASVFGLYPYIRSRNANLFFTVSADSKEYSDFNGIAASPKKIASSALEMTGDTHDSILSGGINSYSLKATQGNVKYGQTPVGTPIPESFQKVGLTVGRLQNVWTRHLQLYGSVKLQQSAQNLDVTEQFHAGGMDAVRAFTEGEGSADNGLMATLELRVLVPQRWLPSNSQCYLSAFYDGARMLKHSDVSAEALGYVNELNYGGPGVGLTFTNDSGWELRASFANRTTGVSLDPSDTATSQFYIQARKLF
jgi:hemolysin activation/secretion protein